MTEQGFERFSNPSDANQERCQTVAKVMKAEEAVRRRCPKGRAGGQLEYAPPAFLKHPLRTSPLLLVFSACRRALSKVLVHLVHLERGLAQVVFGLLA